MHSPACPNVVQAVHPGPQGRLGATRYRVHPAVRSMEGPMARVSIFDSPFFLGFEQFERTFNRVAKSGGDGYPPYNIEQRGEDRLRVSLAVAGFAIDDLSITIEDNQLVIRGRQAEPEGRIYLYRGIAARQFQRTFVLAEGIEVEEATLDCGLLHIGLKRPTAISRLRTVKIKGGATVAPKAVEVESKQVRT